MLTIQATRMHNFRLRFDYRWLHWPDTFPRRHASADERSALRAHTLAAARALVVSSGADSAKSIARTPASNALDNRPPCRAEAGPNTSQAASQRARDRACA